MKANSSLPTSKVNYGDAGIKISNTRHTEDRMVLSSLGAARIEKGIRVTQRSPVPQQRRRIDAWGKPLNLPASERTKEQQRFESHGNLGGQRGGVVGMDPQIQAALKRSTQSPRSSFGNGRSPSKVVRLKMGSPTRVARKSIVQQQQSNVSPAFDRNSWRL